MNKDAYKLTYRYLYYIILILIVGIAGCGKNKQSTHTYKKIEITITGLDGNEVAEKSIRMGLMKMNGVESVSFNYLNNQVVVIFDPAIVSQDSIVQTIQQMDKGRYKILDVKENTEPLQKTEPVIPDPQEDIHDDVTDEYKDNV